MNRGDLVDEIAGDTSLTKKDVSAVIAAFEASVVKAVQKGERVQLPGFLTIERAARAARTARNPRTGDMVNIPATNVPRIKAGKSFKDAVAG